MIPVLIVPGLGGSGEDHWQTHLERSFASAARVQQTDWDRPDLAAWSEQLLRAIVARPGSILVSHSLGCLLVAHVVAQQPRLPIAAALLVAPADVDSERHTPSFLRDFAPIARRPLPFPSIVVASTNDPYMTIERARALAKAWGAEFVEAGACGHINVASGFGPWPETMVFLDMLIARCRAPVEAPGHRFAINA